MPVKEIIYKTTFLSFLLSGCANSLYFYETEKFSLTVEARPDSTQPVQGSLGLKQRVGLIVPGKNVDENNKGSNNGEALSSISNFNLKIIDNEGLIIHPILIQTAFVTGDAAAKLKNPKDMANVAQAITLNGKDIELMEKHADCIFNNAVNAVPNKLDILKEIVEKESSKLFFDKDWNNLIGIGKPCGISNRILYADSVHQALRKKLNK